MIGALIGALLLTSSIGVPAQADSFTAPDYPSADCTPVSGGTQLGLAPQQWNSSVGLPLTPSGTPAAQRIVIGELDQTANFDAVNLLLEQCGLDTVTVTTHTNRASSGAGANVVGLEPTLDIAVAAAALPANAEMILVNSPGNWSWYGVFVNMAEACGLVFDADPFVAVANLSKGPDYPAGGCIISLSWGGPESGQSASLKSDTDQVIGMMADLGVVMLVSAGDEGSGGCISAGSPADGVTNMGSATIVNVNNYAISSNIATFTTSTAHGFTAGQDVFLGALPNADWDGMYRILTIPTSTTFTVGLAASDVASTSLSSTPAAASVDFGGLVPQYPAINPNILAVGGTQWDPQSTSLANGLNVAYVAGAASANYVWWDSFANGNCANLPGFRTTGGEGTGGGQSASYAMPSYQTAAATASYPALPARRMMPDIAALAGWPTYALANPGIAIEAAQVTSNTGVLLVSSTSGFDLGEQVTVSGLAAPFNVLNGTHTITGGDSRVLNFSYTSADIPPAKVSAGTVSQSCTAPCSNTQFPWYQVVGTSAATPLSAIGIANVNAVLSARGLARITNDGSSMDIHNLVYSSANSSAFADVTSGSNDIHSLGGYSAMSGYDMATGMGVPNFSTLANLLIARLTPSSGGGSSPSTATAPEAGTPVTPDPGVVAPNPVIPVVAPPAVQALGGGVVVSRGVNTATTPRVIVTQPASRTRADAPRVPVPIKRWRVPVLDVPGAAREFDVQMRVGRSWRSLGETTSNRRGKVALPAVRMTRVGKYPVRLTDERGRSYYVVLRVLK